MSKKLTRALTADLHQPYWSIDPVKAAVIGVLAGSLVLQPAFAADEVKPANTQSTATEPAKPAAEATVAVPAADAPVASASAAAPKKEEEVESSLGNVVVTANKREETAQKVATAISVLDGKELQEKGIGRSASEVLNYVPNASANTQQNGRPRWWIRGVGAGQQQIDLPSPVGFYRDDVYISNATSTGFPIFDIERVEVLRGPQGTLWGKNTTGGAVNIISKKPSFSEGQNYVKVDRGTYDEQILQGAVGGELVEERVAGRLSFYEQDRDGYYKNLFDGKNSGGIEDRALRGQLLFQLTPDLEAVLNAHHRDYSTNGNTSTVTGTGVNGEFRNGYFPDGKRKHVNSNAESSLDSSQNGISLNVKWQLGRYALTSITAYEDWQAKSLGDGDNTPLEISRSYSNADSKQVSQEFRLASPREDRWNWLTGLHFFKEDIDSYAAGARLPNGSVPQQAGSTAVNQYNDTTFEHKTKSFAIFGSTTYNFTPRFDTTIGARWSTESKELDIARRAGNNITASSWTNLGSWWNSYTGSFGNPPGGLITNFNRSFDKTWDAFTYDVTPQYRISDSSRVFFKYAHGIKSGGFNTAAAADVALNVVKPEELDAYEIGYKSEWLDGTLNFNTNLFYYDYQNVQVNVVGAALGLPNQTVSYQQNASEAYVKGIEFELEALPTSNLRLLANVGIQRSEFQQFDVLNSTTSFAGNELVRTPEFNSLLAASYRIPLADGNKVVVGADWRYTSDQHYFVNAQNAAQNPNFRLLGQESYSLVNARVAYSTRGDRITVTAYVNNLFDKEYIAHALPASGASGATTIYGSPRTAGVSVALRF